MRRGLALLIVRISPDLRFNQSVLPYQYMKIQSLAPNQTQVCLSNGTIVFVSYSTPVAAFIPGRGCVKTAHFWSRTTSKHVNAWCVSQTSTPAATEPQAFFDGLYANA